MLKINIPEIQDLYVNNQFINVPATTLELEHSLVSVHLWESKWHKPFLDNNDKSYEEIIDYVRCMTVFPEDVNPIVYRSLDQNAIKTIIDYINEPMTATWFSGDKNSKVKGRNRREKVTAELIYYWMIASGIPYECREWHLNQLLTLIQVVSVKNGPEKKVSKREAAMQRKALNEARRAKYNSKG